MTPEMGHLANPISCAHPVRLVVSDVHLDDPISPLVLSECYGGEPDIPVAPLRRCG